MRPCFGGLIFITLTLITIFLMTPCHPRPPFTSNRAMRRHRHHNLITGTTVLTRKATTLTYNSAPVAGNGLHRNPHRRPPDRMAESFAGFALNSFLTGASTA